MSLGDFGVLKKQNSTPRLSSSFPTEWFVVSCLWAAYTWLSTDGDLFISYSPSFHWHLRSLLFLARSWAGSAAWHGKLAKHKVTGSVPPQAYHLEERIDGLLQMRPSFCSVVFGRRESYQKPVLEGHIILPCFWGWQEWRCPKAWVVFQPFIRITA